MKLLWAPLVILGVLSCDRGTATGPSSPPQRPNFARFKALKEELASLEFKRLPTAEAGGLDKLMVAIPVTGEIPASDPRMSSLSRATSSFATYFTSPTCENLAKSSRFDQLTHDPKLSQWLVKYAKKRQVPDLSGDQSEMLCSLVDSLEASEATGAFGKHSLAGVAVGQSLIVTSFGNGLGKPDSLLLSEKGMPNDAGLTVVSSGTTIFPFWESFSKEEGEAVRIPFADLHTYLLLVDSSGSQLPVPISVRFFYHPDFGEWQPLNYKARASVPTRLF